MGFIKNRGRAYFLYNLQHELLNHTHNLNRALNGLADYIPNPNQRENIFREQAHLDSMLNGVDVLTNIWQVTPKAGWEAPPILTRALIRDAHTTSLKKLKNNRHLVDEHGHPEPDIHDLENLFHYLDSKICVLKDLGHDCPQYSSFTEKLGYTNRSKAWADRHNPTE